MHAQKSTVTAALANKCNCIVNGTEVEIIFHGLKHFKLHSHTWADQPYITFCRIRFGKSSSVYELFILFSSLSGHNVSCQLRPFNRHSLHCLVCVLLPQSVAILQTLLFKGFGLVRCFNVFWIKSLMLKAIFIWKSTVKTVILIK